MNIRPEQTVADLVIRHPEWRERLEKMGIDYCCGGKRQLGQVVAAAGLESRSLPHVVRCYKKSNETDETGSGER